MDLPCFTTDMARSTTAGFVYQLVEPASSPAPQSVFGHHLEPIGVSITLPSTQGWPAQAFQFLSLHSAASALPPVARAKLMRLAAASMIRDFTGFLPRVSDRAGQTAHDRKHIRSTIGFKSASPNGPAIGFEPEAF